MRDASTTTDGSVVRSSADLVAVDVLASLAALTPLVSPLGAQPIRLILTLPVVLFLPGYTLLSALVPLGDREKHRNHTDSHPRLDGFERAAYSVVLSVLVVAAFAFGLDASGVGIRPVPVLFTITGFILLTSMVAAIRRRPTSVSLPVRVPKRPLRSVLSDGSETDLDRGLNVALVLLIVAAAVSVGVAFAGLGRTESYTEFALHAGNSSGTVPSGVAASDFGGSISVENHEHRRVRYTVVVQRQRVRPGDPSTTRARETLAKHSVTLDSGESRRIPYDGASSVDGPNRRIAFLLYEGTVPSTPTTKNADQELHLWATLGTANQTGTARSDTTGVRG